MKSVKKPDYDALVSHGDKRKCHYTNVGAAWNVAKGGINVKLNAFPSDGNLILLPCKGEK